jgi:uncharacterized protein (TIGR03435 family)
MRAWVIAAALIAAGLCLAQDSAKPLEFEAASVKVAPLPANGFINLGPPSGPGTADPTRIKYNFNTMKNLLMTAYNVKVFQVNGPTWLDTERYDVVATVAPGTTKEQAAIMLQNLLADRFQLKVHRETRELPLYELTIGKGGPKLKSYVVDPNGPTTLDFAGGPPPMGKDGSPVVPPGATLMMVREGKMHMVSKKVTMVRLTDILSNNLRSPVVDKTGITGDYDLDLEFSTDGLAGAPTPPPGGFGTGTGPGPGPNPAAGGDEAPALITAVQDQLGLKLEQKKGPLEMIVVDHAEKTPREN